jgi:homocysteine S-methyltransferase
VMDVAAVVAVGVNCCPPSVATRALETIARACDHPLVVYPNVGDTWDAQARGWRPGAGGDVGTELPRWLAAGARLVGGCCGTDPEHLARLADAITAAGRSGAATAGQERNMTGKNGT